jgi:hypothetical protein
MAQLWALVTQHRRHNLASKHICWEGGGRFHPPLHPHLSKNGHAREVQAAGIILHHHQQSHLLLRLHNLPPHMPHTGPPTAIMVLVQQGNTHSQTLDASRARWCGMHGDRFGTKICAREECYWITRLLTRLLLASSAASFVRANLGHTRQFGTTPVSSLSTHQGWLARWILLGLFIRLTMNSATLRWLN